MTEQTIPEAQVNGESYQPSPGETIDDLVASTCDSPRGIAVSKNYLVIPKSQWHETPVEGNIEIVTAAQGG